MKEQGYTFFACAKKTANFTKPVFEALYFTSMKKLSYILVSLLCYGCALIQPSEKLLVVIGGIQGRLFDEGCEIHLLRATGVEVRNFDVREISTEWYEFSFMVSPSGGEYRVNLICGSRQVSSKAINMSLFKSKTIVKMGLTIEIQT